MVLLAKTPLHCKTSLFPEAPPEQLLFLDINAVYCSRNEPYEQLSARHL